MAHVMNNKIIAVHTINIRSQYELAEPLIKVLLVSGAVLDYAAYIGSGDDDWIVMYGDKLSFKEAKVYFPDIMEDRYRR